MPPKIIIKENYIPKAKQSKISKSQKQRIKSSASAVCPLCQESIAVDEMSQHMRIELLDPKVSFPNYCS